MKRTAVVAVGLLVLGVTVAGCGDDSPSRPPTPDTDDGIPRISGLAFISTPTDSAPNVQLAPAVRIAVVDHKGVPVSSWKAPITISLKANTAGAVLAGPPTVDAVEGTSEFQGLSVNVAGTYSLVASSPGLPSVTSRPFVISDHGWFVPGSGLEGAAEGAVTIDPTSPNTLYFGSRRYGFAGNGGVFTSTSGGKTWSVVGEGLPPTARVVGVDSGSSAVFALDKDDHAWRSDNGGASWSMLNFGMPVSDVAVDARTSGSVWVTGTDGRTLYHSQQAGRLWSEVNTNSGCSQLDVDPTDSNSLFCNAGLRRSRDGGRTFEDVKAGLPSPYFTWFHHVDPLGNVYSAGGQCPSWPCAGASIYKLVKGSSTWRALTGAGLGDLGRYIGSIATSPSSPLTVYVVGFEGLYKSLDGGETFASIGNRGSSYSSLTIDPIDPAVVYASVYGGPSKSTDGGRTFTPIVTGLHNLRVNRLAVGAGASPTIYALAYPGGIIRSADGGRTWSAGSIGAQAIATDPVHENVAWIHSSNGHIQRTTDGGSSWQEVSAKGPDAIAMLSDGTNLWAADAQATVWKSTDGGKQWFISGVALPGNANALMLDPRDRKTLYAATAKGFSKSTDGGASWSNSSHCSKTIIGPNQVLLSMAVSGSYLYMAGTDGHLYVSTDRGETCQSHTVFGAGKIAGLAVDSSDPRTVIAATEVQGLVRITDGNGPSSPGNAGTQGLTFNDVIATPAWGLHTFFAASPVYGVLENSSGGR